MTPRSCFVLRDCRAGRQLLLEQVIVFVGVFAAFRVDNCRESLAEQERSKEVAQGILRGLVDAIKAETSLIEASVVGRADWREARERGESPPAFYFRLTGAKVLHERSMVRVSDRYILCAEFTESTV